MLGAPPIAGQHRITIENIPEDMSWLELRDVGTDFGATVTFSRTYQRGETFLGMLEFADLSDARRVMSELDGRRMEGATIPMRVREGDA